MVVDPAPAYSPVCNAVTHQSGQLPVVHGRMRAQGDQEIESGHPGSQFTFQNVEHQRHGHGAGAVGDQHQNPPAIHVQSRESFGGHGTNFRFRQQAFAQTMAGYGIP